MTSSTTPTAGAGAGTGVTTAAAVTVPWSGANCPELAGSSSLEGDIAQSMDGSLTGCLRVPVVPAGVYYVSLQDVLQGTTAPPGPTTSVAAPAEPPVALSVSPVQAAPGETVRLMGKLASPLAPRPGYGTFCWDGCSGGLVYDGVQLAWLSATTFSAQLTLPDAPWVEQRTAGEPTLVSPVAGTYPLALKCLVGVKECALGGSEGQAIVHLSKPAAYICASMPGCARLSGPAAAVQPGELVQFSGRVPLESIIGAHYPFAFQLSAGSSRPGGPGVTFVHFAKGGVQMEAGAAKVVVDAAPPFSSLPATAPLAELAGGATPISANPLELASVGWCAPGDVEVRGPEGRSQVPVAGATQLLASSGTYQGQVQDQCADLALGSTGPASTFAAFTVLPAEGPMVAEVALFTTDAGRSWSFVPTPPGATRTSFGGFRYQGGDVDALFSPSTAGSGGQSGPPLVEQTADGGRSWARAPFECPPAGPCVTFGAHVPGNCAQGLDSQGVIASSDKGRRWTEPSWPGGLTTCWLTTLEATSPAQALLVTSNTVLGSQSPVDALVTDDGGRSWQALSLPPLLSAPGGAAGSADQAPPGPGDVAVLPDGGLLYVDLAPWQLLAPGAGAWCAVRAVGPGSGPVGGAAGGNYQTVMPTSFAVVGTSLWWLSTSSTGSAPAAVTAHDVGVASLTCAH